MTSSDDLERRLRATAPPTDGDAARPALAELAAAAALLDVAYARYDSPLGALLLAATPAGLVRLAYLDEHDEAAVLADLAANISPRLLAAARPLDAPRRELEEYFAGRRREFRCALDWRLIGTFARRILTATVAIPYGSVSTYQEVAATAGSPRGSRAAGNALGSNPLPIVIPCHRVLRTGGGLGGYTGGLDRKRTLLAIESGQSSLI
jgi:methylated-DNA-[protein]-cysteine S-methyltransferase